MLNNARKYLSAVTSSAGYVIDIIVAFKNSGIAVNTAHVFDNPLEFITFNAFQNYGKGMCTHADSTFGVRSLPSASFSSNPRASRSTFMK